MKKEMPEIPKRSLISHLEELEDPRISWKTRHKLLDILVITICGAICGADDLVSIEQFAHEKEDWFKSFLELPNGIPSHDTFGRVLALLSPQAFEACFFRWIQALKDILPSEQICLDGKVLRCSLDKPTQKSPLHLINAWATETSLVLAQQKVKEGTNEIVAFSEFLKVLEIKGCLVSLDAMGCQKKIAKGILAKAGDYLFVVKKNQKKLYEELEEYFIEQFAKDEKKLEKYESQEKKHGRIEKRSYWSSKEIGEIEQLKEWEGVKTVGLVLAEREENKKRSEEWRYIISSRELTTEELAKGLRKHWQVENQLHWILDVAFLEDQCRVREGYAAENFALIRKIALNLLKQETEAKVGVKTKRLKAGWNTNYLSKVLSHAFF